MAIKSGIKNLNQIKRELIKLRKAPQKALSAIEADIRERAPKWIAAGVVDRYNLEGGKNKGKAAILQGKVGNLKIRGNLKKIRCSLNIPGDSSHQYTSTWSQQAYRSPVHRTRSNGKY